MAKRIKLTTESGNRRKSVFLTKRKLISVTKSGIQQAASDTMKVMGYTVVVDKGWVVKKFPDGTTEKLEKIAKEKTALRLD